MKVDYNYELQNNQGTETSNTDVYVTEIFVLSLLFSLFSAHCEMLREFVLVPKE